MRVYAGRFILLLVLDAGEQNTWAFYVWPMSTMVLTIDEFFFSMLMVAVFRGMAGDRN